jgi:hypothetical protein
VNGVQIWWGFLIAVSAVNIVCWLRLRRRVTSDQQRHQLRLSAVFVFVCAFRSLLPRADVQRICFVDTFLSSVLLGRAVATAAELCFMAQVAAAVRALGRQLGYAPAVTVSRWVLPLIAVAEVCSWYAVVTTNFLGNALEQSLWTVTPIIVATQLVPLARRATGALRRFLIAATVLTAGHVAFMSLNDVPMYVRRFLADQAEGRVYLGFVDGLRDLATRWIVTFSWAEWHDELAWMGLYFSVAVWFSMALVLRSPATATAKDTTRG